ncbi:hypothetical protein GGF44_002463, partial [Coemansia sp. RSA 1694]
MPEILVSAATNDLSHPTCKKSTAAAATAVGVCPIAHHQTGTATDEKSQVVYSETQEDESLRQALKLLAPTRDDFRLADYATSFNWSDISSEFHSQLSNYSALPSRSSTATTTKEFAVSWYAVVFRSKRRADCNNIDLYEADRLAYNEAFATTNGSLLAYWYTDLDGDNNCLATCVWTSRDIARSVNLLPRHREAARLSAGSYVHYNID